jgi:hypothetical protein
MFANPGAAWHVVSSGDFNSDIKTDLVLQNKSGAIAVWDMNGSTISQSGVLANPPARHGALLATGATLVSS